MDHHNQNSTVERLQMTDTVQSKREQFCVSLLLFLAAGRMWAPVAYPASGITTLHSFQITTEASLLFNTVEKNVFGGVFSPLSYSEI